MPAHTVPAAPPVWPRIRRHLLVVVAAVLLTLGAATPATAAPAESTHADGKGLRDLAARSGLDFGNAIDTDALAGEPAYRALVAREFSSLTAENVMKWETVEPSPGVDDFAAADVLLAFAKEHGQTVRGHTLLWHNQLPTWITPEMSPAELRQILKRHVFTVVEHFEGRLTAWDAVNEPFNEDGTWRETMWFNALGPGYIADVLRWAHEADPDVKLYLNDFNIEGLNPKSDAMYALVQDLQAQGIPIHGVGVQGHLSIEYPYPEGVTENLQRFADLGLEVAITEADVRMLLPATPEKLATHAQYFDQLLRSCLAVPACINYTVWGVSDAHSWVPGVFEGEGAATLFDENLQPKPSYEALAATLAEQWPQRK